MPRITHLLLLALSLPLAAQTPADLLAKATTQSDLYAIQQPWRAKLVITIFDAKGQNPTDGTFEYWQNGKDSLRKVTFGDTSEAILKQDNKLYENEVTSSLIDTTDEFIGLFLHPGPEPNDPGLSTTSLSRQDFGKVSLTCLMLGPDVIHMQKTPLGLFPTYCVEPDSANFRVNFSLGGKQLTIIRSGKFLDHIVPIEFTLGENGVVIAHAKVTEMTAFAPAPDFFAPKPDLPPVAGPVGVPHVGMAIVTGNKISGDQPSYPVSARQARIEGPVTLHAIISRDGHIRFLRVMTAPSPDLALSALAAVRTWRYKPYLLNGKPTSVDTTIVINYNIGG